MRHLAWKPEKNDWLKKERGLSFEQIEDAIAAGKIKGMLKNQLHVDQIVIAVLIDDYIVAVPATVKRSVILLRTAYYSRKLNEKYGG